MIGDLLTIIGYVIGGIALVGGIIAAGIVIVGALAGLYQLGAWVIDGIRD